MTGSAKAVRSDGNSLRPGNRRPRQSQTAKRKETDSHGYSPPSANIAKQHAPAHHGSSGGAVDKNMFMKLLVAQLRHQDPMKPTDGMQFVAELAQFQQLEQTINAGEDIAAIRADLDLLAHPESES